MQINKAFSHCLLIWWLLWHHGGLLAHFTREGHWGSGKWSNLPQVPCSGWSEPTGCGSPCRPGQLLSPPAVPWPPPPSLQPPGFSFWAENPHPAGSGRLCSEGLTENGREGLAVLWGHLCCLCLSVSNFPCRLPLLEMVACPHWSLPACSLWVLLNTDRSFRDKKNGWSREELLFACRMMAPYQPYQSGQVAACSASYSYIRVFTLSLLWFFVVVVVFEQLLRARLCTWHGEYSMALPLSQRAFAWPGDRATVQVYPGLGAGSIKERVNSVW